MQQDMFGKLVESGCSFFLADEDHVEVGKVDQRSGICGIVLQLDKIMEGGAFCSEFLIDLEDGMNHACLEADELSASILILRGKPE
jgi:hypothetical protein